MAATYYYTRFKWWTGVDLKKAADELRKGGFEAREIAMPRSKDEVSLYKDQRNEIEVKSDTLTARLSAFRASISQKKPVPFTARDLELRKRVLALYPRNRPTPFPWEFSTEPKFEVAK